MIYSHDKIVKRTRSTKTQSVVVTLFTFVHHVFFVPNAVFEYFKMGIQNLHKDLQSTSTKQLLNLMVIIWF